MSAARIRSLLLIFCWALGASPVIAAEIPFVKLKQSALPPGLPVDGKFVAALAWTDVSGKNYAVLSQKETRSAEGDASALHAAGYRFVDGELRRTWAVKDGVDACNLDLSSFFELASFELTDLDDNKLGEVSFVYRMACNGGLDYVDEKLFLIENGKKYPIRGKTELTGVDESGRGGYYDGPMAVDKAFLDAPPAFKAFAVAKWRRFRRPTGW